VCDFMSFYVGWKGEIYVGDFRSHASAEEAHNLSEALKSSKRPPVPAEWTEEDPDALSVRVPDSIDRDEAYYKALVLGEYESRVDLILSVLKSSRFGGGLNLEGCTGLTTLPDGLSVGRSLYLRGCTGLTALPDGLSVGGGLNLRGCTRKLKADAAKKGFSYYE